MVSALAAAAAVYLGVDLTYIHSHFLQLATSTFLISVLLSAYLYVRSRYAEPAQLALGGNSGKGKDLQFPDQIHCFGPFLLIHLSGLNKYSFLIYSLTLCFFQAMWFMIFSKDVSSIPASKTLI